MVNPSDIDTPRLKRDLVAAAHEARDLKRLLGATWTRPMAAVQKALAELRRHTTRLCVLRAFLRGKHHCSTPARDGDWHARIAERAAREYLRETSVSAGTGT